MAGRDRTKTVRRSVGVDHRQVQIALALVARRAWHVLLLSIGAEVLRVRAERRTGPEGPDAAERDVPRNQYRAAGHQRVPPIRVGRTLVEIEVPLIRDVEESALVARPAPEIVGLRQRVRNQIGVLVTETLLEPDEHRFVLCVADGLVLVDESQRWLRPDPADRIRKIPIDLDSIPSGVHVRAVDVNRHIGGHLLADPNAVLLGPGVPEIVRKNVEIWRRRRRERQRILSQIRIGVRWIHNRDRELGEVAILAKDIIQRTDVVVVDARHAFQDGVAIPRNIPADADTRAKVVRVAARFRIGKGHTRIRRQAFVERSELAVVAETEIECHVRAGPPHILDEPGQMLRRHAGVHGRH